MLKLARVTGNLKLAHLASTPAYRPRCLCLGWAGWWCTLVRSYDSVALMASGPPRPYADKHQGQASHPRLHAKPLLGYCYTVLSYTDTHTDRQTGRQADRQTDRNTDKHQGQANHPRLHAKLLLRYCYTVLSYTDTHTDRQTDRQAGR
jgi:hypothetical protein